MRLTLVLVLTLVLLAGISLLVGVADLSGQAGMILTLSRLPRTFAVILTGAALAITGVVMQQLVRNKFVEPSTTGTGEAAALGLLAIMLIAPQAPLWVKMLAASAGGLADAEMQQRLTTEGAVPVGDSPAEFAAFVREDIKRWAPLVKASGAKPN